MKFEQEAFRSGVLQGVGWAWDEAIRRVEKGENLADVDMSEICEEVSKAFAFDGRLQEEG